MSAGDWLRVNWRRPCPVCGRPDWCLVSRDDPGDPSAAICQRVQEGAARRVGDAGYLHLLRERPGDWRRRSVTLPVASEPHKGFGALAERYERAGVDRLPKLADRLGVSVESLEALGVGWTAEHSAWTFPMTDATGRVVGIRLRLPSGRKLSLKGGREGLFIPRGMEPGGQLIVTEGASDAAAGLGLGFQAVGRPSCTGGVKLLCGFVKSLRPVSLILFADADSPGANGAEVAAVVLLPYVRKLRVVWPPRPYKDLRAWVGAGATRRDVQRLIDSTPPRTLRVRARRVGR